ncbi:MAG: adenylate/guanylate cyclase domain-containing protein, partial [Pseudomonadales bacterium]|nr:adenylate/guanylate cyclase domain-containing protein [Pseudomonadales bacterium]
KRQLGYIPSNPITENSARIGAAIEVILLSIALADRINQFKREHQQEIELRLLALEKVEQMHEVFGKFVPHQFIELLQKDDLLSLKPGDHIQRTMTILFSDIRAFTELSESMTPTENFKFINSYLRRMEPHIQQHNGFIDKFIGDAIMALFDESPDDAVKAGVSMIKSLDTYNEHRISYGYRPLTIGVGINTGKLILGTVGDDTRMDSTVISDAVNLASRIEGLCKTYGVYLLISHETYVSLNNPTHFNCRLIDIVKTKGKQQETIIYEVIDADTNESATLKIASIDKFNNAISHFQTKEFEKALVMFNDIVALHPEDNPAKVYSTRCEEEIRHIT